jgi:hypothetical protein
LRFFSLRGLVRLYCTAQNTPFEACGIPMNV